MSLRRRLEALESAGTPIRVGLVGAGQMGRGFVAQVAGIPGMEVTAAADLDVELALDAFRGAGQDPVEGIDGSPGRPAATADFLELTRSGVVDVVVEATGIPEVGARVAYESIHNGKHVVMLNVETDVTVGPLLDRMARSAGVVYTGSAGDEPGVIMDLYDFAESLGLNVVAVGKGKNNPLDPSATPASLAEEAAGKNMNPKMLASFVDGTKTMVEMAAVANATGFAPDVPGMHGPSETDPARLAGVFSLEEEGGLLSGYSVVDFVLGVAPGVFVVVRPGSAPVRETLAYVGQGQGPNYVLYRPYHLTSLETPLSVARAAIYGEETITPRRTPTAEVAAVAKRDLAAGTRLGGIGGEDYHGFTYRAAEAKGMVPCGVAAGAWLTKDVPRGEPIRRDAVELDGESFVVNLRRLQEAGVG